jgi:hypothetical protein
MAAINLKKIPDHILKYLLKVQWEAKSAKRISQYSLEKTVYKIIEEHEELKKQKK